MGKIIETQINRFDGGIDNDPLSPVTNVANMISNFNNRDNPRQLKPYRSTTSGDSDASNTQKRRFVIAHHSGTEYRLFSFGQDADGASGDAEIESKKLTTTGGGENDLADATWNKPGNNVYTASAALHDELWVYYEKADRCYFGHDNRYISDFDPDGSNAAGGDQLDLTSYTTIRQGIVHSKDDRMYIPYDNKIAKHDGSAVNGSAWTSTALTLPTFYRIECIAEYGDFIAIGAIHKSGVGNSRIFLWDRNTTDVTLSASIDWGEGELKVLAEIEGELIGITERDVDRTYNLVSDWIFKRYVHGLNAAQTIVKLNSTNTPASSTNQLSLDKQIIDNRLFFGGRFHFNQAVREGIFSIGRGSSPTGYTIVHEHLVNNGTALTDNTNSAIVGFLKVGDFFFISYRNNGTWALDKTVSNAEAGAASRFTSNSICEKRFNTEGSGKKKNLVGVTVEYDYLDNTNNGEQVSLNYRTDQNTAWTEIFTDNTDNSFSHSAVNIESSGANLPNDYKEIEFQIESTGGAIIRGLKFTEDITDKRPYAS